MPKDATKLIVRKTDCLGMGSRVCELKLTQFLGSKPVVSVPIATDLHASIQLSNDNIARIP